MAARAAPLRSSPSADDDGTPSSDRRSEVLSFLSGALRGDTSVEVLLVFRRRRGRLGVGLVEPERREALELSESLEALVEDSGLDTLSRKGKSTVGRAPPGEKSDGCRGAGLISRAFTMGLASGFSSSSELELDE